MEITIDDIMATGPCWDRAQIEALWPDSGTVTARMIADSSDVNAGDTIWILTRLLPPREQRLFACWCVRQVWDLLTDDRSRTAVEVAERYANGESTDDELAAAWAAARAAAGGAAWAAARAAGDAAWAAGDAAWAAGDAAWAAGDAAGDAARAAAWAAAWDAAGDAQIKQLVAVHEGLT